MACIIRTTLSLILFVAFILAAYGTAELCEGCRNNACFYQSNRCRSDCIKGYFKKLIEEGKNNFTCRRCPDTCQKCTSLTNCSACTHGRWDESSTCTRYCPPNCVACLTPTNCTKCIDGKFGNQCTQVCPSDCKACTSQTQCDKCQDRLWGDLCNKTCPEGCKLDTCEHLYGGCSSCKQGYFSALGAIGEPTCLRCKIRQCLRCRNENTCDECEIGWYGTLCDQKCSPKCVNRSCKRNGECICKIGYHKTYVKNRWYQCSECPNGCAKCDSATNCIECLPGLWKHDCSQNCSIGCYGQSCDPTTGRCNNGCVKGLLTLGNGSCIDCSRVCAKCPSDSACKKCHENGACDEWVAGDIDDFRWLMYVLIGLTLLAICFIFTMASLMARRLLCARRTTDAVEGKLFRKRKSREFKNTIRGSSGKQSRRLYVTSAEEMSKCPLPPLPSRTEALENLDDGGPSRVEIPLEDDEGLYYNTTSLHRNQIPILELQKKVASMSKANFRNEFMRLPSGLLRPYRDAVKPENVHKNRYLDIYPFDATRVILTDGPGDYINASYVEGHSNQKAYIAALGPTRANSEGFSLFWRMVWQEKVEVIVMLTNLMEGPTMKCEKYWPSVQSCIQYGDVTVEGLTESKYAEYVARELIVSKGDERRKLTQMHFSVWPDKSVPNEERSLVDFRDQVNKIPRDYQQPIVVHCSAGIGRTGTYIALDILMEQGQAKQSVDIFSCVAALRGQRVNLVQNEIQYEYIHHALVYGFGRDVMYANVVIQQNV